ncbi:succinate dehydrogenase cytochrome b subunit [Kocuria sp.]|uniref:succinate dehydrogenase cytochrome b subunit n=1 Tax=Kocuria sp. TaxID=1871328 RepID=UPI0026DF4FED|nr:succinate dehydrogenase cytochrome b subunit [Kocuria sp.]MDO5619234.1 succinate dehydrogenase cytochrome b subunit [Kocuria sp.]
MTSSVSAAAPASARGTTSAAATQPQLRAVLELAQNAVDKMPPSPQLKLAMASSGTIFSAFTVAHMLGNLQVYLGQQKFDDYAHFLRTVGAPVLPRGTVLWFFRVGLLASTATHLSCAAALTVRAQQSASRPRAQKRTQPRGRRRTAWEVAKRSMRSTGTVLGLFAAHHLADLTLGVRPAAAQHTPGAAYRNLVTSLQRPSVAALYLAAMVALAAHTAQGITQVGNDTGLSADRRTRQVLELAGRLVGTGVALGNASIPVAIQLRLVR